MRKTFPILIYAISGIFFLLFLFIPITHTLQEAFFTSDGDFTLAYFIELFRNPVYTEGLWNSFLMGGFTTLLSLLLALPLALLFNTWRFPGRELLNSLVLVPLILPPFVGALGVRQILGQSGSLNSLLIELGMMDPMAPMDWLGESRLLGVVLMNALHLYPIAYLNITAALSNVDPAVEEAAENLGCHGIRRIFRITLPLIAPGVFAGSTIIFIWAFTELGVPLIFDFERVTSVQIFHGIKDLSGNPFPYALVIVLLLLTIGFYLGGKMIFGRTAEAVMNRASISRNLKSASRPVSWLFTGLFLGVIFFATIPHLGVVLLSFSNQWYGTILPSDFTAQHYVDALGHPLTIQSIGNSLKYASLATGLDLVLGVAIA